MPPLCTVTIDTEEEWDWSAGWPTSGFGTKNIHELPRFQELCDRYNIATTFFTAYAVLHDANACGVIQSLANHPHVEIGMHIHPWNTPPLVSCEPVAPRETFLHNLPEDVVFAKLQCVYDAFAAAGLKPFSFRGGRYSTSPSIQCWLRQHGFIVDASVVPYTKWKDDGAPNYEARTCEPVRHSETGPCDAPFWELPLTRGFTRLPFHVWQRRYATIQQSWLRKLRLLGLAEMFGVVRKVWLNFEQHPPKQLLAFLQLLRGLNLPHVCLTFHSSSLRAGFSPYVRTQADEAQFYASLETVFRYVKDHGFQPATMSDVARHLESMHASSRNQPAR